MSECNPCFCENCEAEAEELEVKLAASNKALDVAVEALDLARVAMEECWNGESYNHEVTQPEMVKALAEIKKLRGGT